MAKKKEEMEQLTEEVMEEVIEEPEKEEPAPETPVAPAKGDDFKARKLRGINLMSNERRRKLHAQWLLRNK